MKSKIFPIDLKIGRKKIKAELEVSTSKNSFTLWVFEGKKKSRHWVLDYYKGKITLLSNFSVWAIGFTKADTPKWDDDHYFLEEQKSQARSKPKNHSLK